MRQNPTLPIKLIYDRRILKTCTSTEKKVTRQHPASPQITRTSPTFRMQFDCMKLQQHPETLGSNDHNSNPEIAAGELHAKLIVSSAMREQWPEVK